MLSDTKTLQSELQRFGKLLSQLLDGVPADAGAVLVAKMAQELNRQGGPEAQNAIENLLQLMWLQIAPEILKHMDETPKECDVAAMFLERYFHFRGDWNAEWASFEKDFAERHPQRADWLAEQVEKVRQAVATSLALRASGRGVALLN